MIASVWTSGLAAIGTSFGVTVVLTREVLELLRRHRILDRPNERSMHANATPRGGGIAVMAAVLLVWGGLAVVPGPLSAWAWVGIGGALLLMTASWADDRHNLPQAPRLLAHIGAVGGALCLLPGDLTVFSGLVPVWADRLITALAWVWFTNLYNFMDGIDGITGVETAALGLGIAVIGAVAAPVLPLAPFGLALAGGGLGFLVWNWHPARVFLGDVGSVPLGFLLGGLLLHLALAGYLAAAVILPAYYLADATITLVHRLIDGERIWQAHRRHFYQRAVRGGTPPNRVALFIAGGNAGLVIAAGLTAAGSFWTGVIAAGLVVTGMLACLQLWARGAVR